MRRAGIFWVVAIMACALTQVWAQDDASVPSQEPPASSQQQPSPAYGQEGQTAPISQNPPISGLDMPSLEPHAAPLSYLQPGATFSESVDTNIGNTLGGSTFGGITRGLGSVVLKRLWSHYDLALDYVGGVGYYHVSGEGFKSLQSSDIVQKILWKRGQLSLRNSFSYLPEGSFGGAYGSLGSAGISSIGSTPFGAFWGGTGLGTLGLTPRILNVSIADVTQTLTPKSAITVAGGYAFNHFYGNNTNGAPFIGSSQVSAQAGYNRILTSHTQIALVYGYQGFDFTALGSAFHSHVVEALVGHRISGRMDLLVGAGPQFTRINTPCTILDVGSPGCNIDQSGQLVATPTTKIGVAAQARLRYRFTKTSMELTYQRYLTTGSGLFAGAQSDIVHLNAERPLSRVWSAFADIGYSHNSRLQGLSSTEKSTCGGPSPQPPCPGVDANYYNLGFFGGGVHRAFGRNLHGFVSYQFNELAFDHSYCAATLPCDRISNRQVVTFGLDWTPRPIRID